MEKERSQGAYKTYGNLRDLIKAVAEDVKFKWVKSYEDFKSNRLNANVKGV